ncbi:hypothetical protein JKP88DRAFT_246943 [Tribonema minus]|uniref:Uncharacterized protein n=1 Tax=Tribonema minus TaxID=303371 RepID=A0A836CBK8_9STRA|nr:hypothetical protein JKP88DRAFT_246943 [Tribonema minus]
MSAHRQLWTASDKDVNLTSKEFVNYKACGSFKGDYLQLCSLAGVIPHPCILPALRTAPSGDVNSSATLSHNASRYDMKDGDRVNVSNHVLDPASLALLLKALSLNPAVTALDLHNAGLATSAVAAIAAALPTTALSALSISFNPVDDDTVFAKLLADGTALRALTLRGDAVASAGAAALAAALEANTRLAALNLFANAVGDAGAAALADALLVNTALAGLSLARNALTAAGADALARALRGVAAVAPGAPLLARRAAAELRVVVHNKAAAEAARKKKGGGAEPQLLPALPPAAPCEADGSVRVAGNRTLAVLNLDDNGAVGTEGALLLLEAVAGVERGALGLKLLRLQRCGADAAAIADAAARAAADSDLQIVTSPPPPRAEQ